MYILSLGLEQLYVSLCDLAVQLVSLAGVYFILYFVAQIGLNK